jgi:hypothetical protein
VALSVELPTVAADGEVANMQRALLRAIQDQLQDALDDVEAAAALVGNATEAVTVAPRPNGDAPDTYVYTLTAGVPTVLQGGGGAILRGRRALASSAGAISAALNDLLRSGYLLQRLHEEGVDADALASSGALSMSGGIVAPPPRANEGAAPASPSLSPAAAGSPLLSPAAALGVSLGILVCCLFSAFGAYQWCIWERRAAARRKGDAAPTHLSDTAVRPNGVALQLREEVDPFSPPRPPPVPALSPASMYSASGLDLGKDSGAAFTPAAGSSAAALSLVQLGIYANVDEAPLGNGCGAPFLPLTTTPTHEAAFSIRTPYPPPSPLSPTSSPGPKYLVPPRVHPALAADFSPPAASRSLSPTWRANAPTQELFVSDFFRMLLKGNETGATELLMRAPGLAHSARDGLLPLHAAVRAKSVPLAQLLLRAGADPAAVDSSGRTAAELAAMAGAAGMVALLESARVKALID